MATNSETSPPARIPPDGNSLTPLQQPKMEAAPLTFTAPTDLPVTEADSQAIEVHELNIAEGLQAMEEQSQAMEVQELDATEELPAKKGHSQAMEVHESDATEDLPAMKEQSQVDFQEKLHEVIACGSLDFDAWTSLIAGIEKIHPDNIEALSLVYDSFLSMFPLCYGYWKKYANHKMHLCNVGKAVETFERAVQSATYSVGFWVEYCSFGIIAFEDPFHVRRLFKRGISFVGKDYLSHTLWDKYIAFEYSQQHWSSLPHIFLQALRFPTKKLHGYYQNLKKFVTLLREEMQGQNIFNSEVQAEALPDAAVPVSEDEISRVIKDLQDPSNGSLRSKALQRYMSIAEHVYHKACQLDEKIQCFEANVRRPFFHVKPLDENELANWHCYLDFIERQEDFDWAVKLYEKCLIACASYPEFWMRYVEFMETKGGRELANFALERATQTFLKNVPAIHLFNARFKEKIGDVRGARTAFLHCDAEFDSCFVDNVMKEANMERRLGNLAAASSIYEKALKLAADTQKLHNVSILYIHFSRLKYMITGCAEAARDIIVDGIKQVPSCRLLLEELIRFVMTHEGSRHVNIVDSIIAGAIAPKPDVSLSLGTKDREDLSFLYLEFVDLCGTNHDVRNAWNRHIKLFPHLIRTPSMHENPTSSNYLLNLLMEGKLEDSIDSPNKPSEGHCSKQLLQFSVQEEELSPPENQASQPDQVLAEQYQPNEIENSAKEVRQLKLQVEVHSSEDAAGLDKKFTPDLVHKSGNNDAFGTSELTRPLVNQPTEDTSRPMESAQDLVRQSQEDSTGESIHVELPSGQVKPVGASQDHFALVNTQQEQDAELQNCSEPVSLESLPLNLQEKASQHLVPMVCDERNIRQEIPTSSGNIQGCHPLASPNSSLAVQSAKVQNELGDNESESHSFSKRHRPNPVHTQEVHQDRGEKWSHVTHMITSSHHAASGDSKQEQPTLHHPQPTVELDAQMKVASGTHGHNQYQTNVMPSHAWPVQNVHQHSSQPQNSQQHAFSQPEGQMYQYPVQISEHSQTYHQMLHYHYQQQQQLLHQQYQQQLLQMQQPYAQQLQLQQLHQQPCQQHQLPQQPQQNPQHQPLFQQQNYLQQQQQLQLPPSQPEKIQQQQYVVYLQQGSQQTQQQQQLQQGQQYYQLEEQQRQWQLQQYYQHAQHPNQLGHQLQVEQGCQLPLQQYQLQQEYQQSPPLRPPQQQGQYQPIQQQQEQQKQHQQHQDEEQQQNRQKISPTRNRRRSRSHHLREKGITPPLGTLELRHTESVSLQEQSPHVVTRPPTVGAIRPVGSPDHQQLPLHKVSPSDAGTSEPPCEHQSHEKQ